MNIDDLVREVKEKKPKKVLLQLPEGLKTSAIKIAEAIKKEGIDVMLFAEPCYGACDLPTASADADLIVHVGHSKFYRDFRTAKPVLYYPWRMAAETGRIDFSRIKEKRIGILTTVQHVNAIDDVFEQLKKAGKIPIEGGQILGCWTANAEKIKARVDAFLFIGSGSFHPLGLKSKKIYSLNLEKNIIEEIDNSRMEKMRFANIYRCRDVKSFGILVSTKPGQLDIVKAEKIKKELEKKDKKAFILIMNEISDDKLLGIDVGAFINTACPRILDNQFSKPIINAEDLKEILK